MAFLTERKVQVGAIAVVASAWNAFYKGMDLKIVASAGLSGSPYAYQIIKKGDGAPMVKDMVPGAMTVVFVYSGKFIKDKLELAKKFMVALLKGARAMQGDKFLDSQNMAAYLKYQKAAEESIRKGMPCSMIRTSKSRWTAWPISNAFI